MDFRMYDNALGRFYGMDALSEKNHYLSPFQFGNGNPVFWADPTGLDVESGKDALGRDKFDKWGMYIPGFERGDAQYSAIDAGDSGVGGDGVGQPTAEEVLNFIMNTVRELNIDKIYYKVNDNGSITYSYMKEFSVSHKYLEDGADLIGITVGLKKITKTVFLGEKGQHSGFDIDKAINHLNENANTKSKAKCALYVRQALNAGGLEGLSGHAYQYYKSGKLENKGFKIVSENNSNFIPQKGDISVFDKTGGRKWGHIAMFNGNQWVSDFRQKSIFTHSDYINANLFVIYRAN